MAIKNETDIMYVQNRRRLATFEVTCGVVTECFAQLARVAEPLTIIDVKKADDLVELMFNPSFIADRIRKEVTAKNDDPDLADILTERKLAKVPVEMLDQIESIRTNFRELTARCEDWRQRLNLQRSDIANKHGIFTVSKAYREAFIQRHCVEYLSPVASDCVKFLQEHIQTLQGFADGGVDIEAVIASYCRSGYGYTRPQIYPDMVGIVHRFTHETPEQMKLRYEAERQKQIEREKSIVDDSDLADAEMERYRVEAGYTLSKSAQEQRFLALKAARQRIAEMAD